MLIGERLSLSFPRCLFDASVLVILGLGAVWLIIQQKYSREWQLLVLFAALFVLNHPLIGFCLLERVMGWLNAVGLNVRKPGWRFILAVIISNLVSIVPATMLLLPVASSPLAGSILALARTFAGNLLVVGSIANLIVLDQAERLDSELRITWREHPRVGVPVILVTLALEARWLSFIMEMVLR